MARVLLMLLCWTGTALGAPSNAALQRVLASSHASRPAARAAAVKKLGAMDDPRAFSAVVEALADASPVVRLAACKALSSRGDDAAVAPLERAARDNNARVAAAARNALGAVKQRSAGPVSRLVVVQVADGPPSHRAVAKALHDALTTQLQLKGLMVVANIPQGARGHQVEVVVQDVRTQTTDDSAKVEVSAAATVLTWPGRNLRLNTRSSASDGVEGGTVSDEEKLGLAQNAAQAVAHALAQDIQGYLSGR
jgi:HEAT repeat protein